MGIEETKCADIYKEEINISLKSLRRSQELLSKHWSYQKDEIFKFSDDDFYYFRYVVDREEQSAVGLLSRILYRVMDKYHIDYELSDNPLFDFIVKTENGRFGYRYADFYDDEDINDMLDECNVDKAFIIRTERGYENRHSKATNNRFKNEEIRTEVITLQAFFEEYFTADEFSEFDKHIKDYIAQTKQIVGIKSIKVLSAMNLSARKAFENNMLQNWDYEHSKYQIIDAANPKIKDYTYVGNLSFDDSWKVIFENYKKENLYRSMIGHENYAESFLSSEWLYYSLKDEKNFDYTAIVSGYLKSIEQLLFKLVILNTNNNCYISIKPDAIQLVQNAGISIYKMKKNINNIYSPVLAGSELPKYPYMEHIDSNKEYMDSSIGTFEYFFRNNRHVFSDSTKSKNICDMVSCFRAECRNGYFHIHNLHDISVVEKTRENAILLYALLLGSVTAAKDKKSKLGIINEDRFDSICKEIRELRHYSPDFTFVYEDGTEKKMIYDFLNNTAEFTDKGIEHYESLIFYEVDDFSLETHERLNTPIREEWKRLLTRDNLPRKIYCYDINMRVHEVTPVLLQ